MPLVTIASAISRTILSLTSLRKRFQLFHPMGGVFASPFDFTGEGIERETGAGRGGRGSGTAVETRDNSKTSGGRFGGPPGPGPRPEVPAGGAPPATCGAPAGGVPPRAVPPGPPRPGPPRPPPKG